MNGTRKTTYALFYDAKGNLVWDCQSNARYELSNGSKAVRKGATHGVLFESGVEIDRLTYNPAR
ncbi:hypothetical protein [Pontibacter burrus]|uniref:Uncharacterized protein n=1 Tax=Pontibacter burrus TaxID=2704466 RepID=A0A6B3LPU5_9BACT|nr:hypothetical protein [Pontibacter burrus]NEM96196.1 hypothetical protein [Pontibacter burrus]